VEPLNLVFFPHFFQPEIEDQRFLFVGPSIRQHEQPDDFPLDRLQGESTLYISLGTVFTNKVDFYRMCFTAFGDKPWPVVMGYGSRLDRGALGPVPSNFLVAPHVPQLAVLRRSAVFLTHGGMNSVVEALYYGVPMVLCPQTHEQILTAKRIAALGLGVMLIAAIVSDATLGDAVEQIMGDPAFHARARQVQAELQAGDGHRRAVDALAQVRSIKEAV
jgi:MGT family glycosyltransferase